MEKKKHNYFTDGAISPDFIAASIARHSSKTNIGAHDIFLGQVRADQLQGKTVTAIEYSAYNEMAEKIIHDIRENAFARYPITCLHVHHSTGRVNAGEICLFVFVSAPHRREAFDCCRDVVEAIKAQVPVWGREILNDESHSWKVNT